jgi:hypothetical protein
MTSETKEFTISKETAVKYLMTYVADGEDEWLNALSTLVRRNKDKDLVREIISATILLPSMDRNAIPEIPYNLLFYIKSYDQFKRYDNWQQRLSKVLEEDEEISELRNKLVVLGCIDPIEYAPYTRQAFRWLVNESKEAGDFTAATEAKLKSLVHVYGGVSISKLFSVHKGKLSKLTNWRSHYFFEKALHNTYTIEQLIDFKQKELEKTNPSLVKRL